MARATAVAEVDACTLQADPFHLVAAAALCGVIRVDAAFAAFSTGAEDSLVTLDLDDMPPFHGLIAFAVAR